MTAQNCPPKRAWRRRKGWRAASRSTFRLVRFAYYCWYNISMPGLYGIGFLAWSTLMVWHMAEGALEPVPPHSLSNPSTISSYWLSYQGQRNYQQNLPKDQWQKWHLQRVEQVVTVFPRGLTMRHLKAMILSPMDQRQKRQEEDSRGWKKLDRQKSESEDLPKAMAPTGLQQDPRMSLLILQKIWHLKGTSR